MTLTFTSARYVVFPKNPCKTRASIRPWKCHLHCSNRRKLGNLARISGFYWETSIPWELGLTTPCKKCLLVLHSVFTVVKCTQSLLKTRWLGTISCFVFSLILVPWFNETLVSSIGLAALTVQCFFMSYQITNHLRCAGGLQHPRALKLWCCIPRENSEQLFVRAVGQQELHGRQLPEKLLNQTLSNHSEGVLEHIDSSETLVYY